MKSIKKLRFFLSIFFCIALFSTSCGNDPKVEEIKKGAAVVVPPTKPIVNVYIENSGSMFGYVKGITEFEQAVYNYLTDIKISGITDEFNLCYINSNIIPQGSDISDFIEKLEPSTFKLKGGNLGTSDIANVLKSVLSGTQENDISILVTDGIFSPGKGKNAAEYLVNQQIGIKTNMAEYLKLHPNTAVIVYQLSSHFNGYYYNREDFPALINETRPFYIWVIGNLKNLDKLRAVVPDSKFKGSGVLNAFSITAGPKKIDYAIKIGSGKFSLDKKAPKNTIVSLQKDTKGNQNSARFSVNTNFSGLLLDDNYLNDVSNYERNSKDYNLIVSKAGKNQFGYTHTLNFSSDKVHKGFISVKLKNRLPDWINKSNDDDGSTHVPGRTYGIKYQIQGIYEAFTFDKDFYTEIKINIK